MSYPEDLKELYFGFGLTAEMAQVMEVEAGNFALTFVTAWYDSKQITDEQRDFFQALIKDIKKRTFGNLVRQIISAANLDDKLVEIIENALVKRNYLAHEFFPSNNFAIHSKKGRKIMRDELNEIYKALDLANSVLSGMTATFKEIMGQEDVSIEMVEKMIADGKSVKI